MKKSLQLFLGASLFASGNLLAQPTLTAAGCNLVVGDQIIQSTSSYVAPGSAGASQTWNLGAMTTAATGTINAVTPGSTTNGSSYPSANVAINTASGTAYYKTSAASLQNYGAVAGGVVIVYSNPEDFFHWPCSYTNSFTDSWAATFVSGGSTFYRTGNSTVTSDGYGTVTTPSGTYPNVMRFHMVETYQDSANIFGTPFINNYVNDEYLWLDNSHHIPIATVYTFTTVIGGGSPTVTQGGSYFGAPVGIEKSSELSGSLKLYPNPVTDNLYINMELSRNQKAEIKLINPLGQEIGVQVITSALQGPNEITADLGKYANGIYFVQVYLNGTLSATRRFIISR